MNELKFNVAEQLQQLHMFMLRTAHRGYKRRGGRHNPYRGQGRVLLLLKMKPEISQKELAYLLDISKQSLAELLSKLEAGNLITREHLDDDKRANTVKLTQTGMAAADNIDGQETDAAQVLDCLSDDELSVFGEYLGRIIKRFEEQYPGENFEERRKIMDEYMGGRRGHHNHSGHRRGSDGHGGNGRHKHNGSGFGYPGEHRHIGRGNVGQREHHVRGEQKGLYYGRH